MSNEIVGAQALREAAEAAGMLPFFRCQVEGISMEERIPAAYWFPDEGEGAWEWRMQVLSMPDAPVYGKFFHNKAGFIARRLMPDFCNFRRDGYDFDTRFELGMANEKCARLVRALSDNGPLLTQELKRLSGVRDGYETAITKLMMGGYVCISGFGHAVTKAGVPYGWGVAQYDLLDRMLGEDVTRARYDVSAEESLSALCEGVGGMTPQEVRVLLGGKA